MKVNVLHVLFDYFLQTFQVALLFRNSTLRHRMALENEAWFTQIVDLFDVVDYPVKGYEPPDTVTELNLTLQACGIDYRPLHLPFRAYVTLETFCLSSNISPQSRTSVLRFIIEDGALFWRTWATFRKLLQMWPYQVIIG